MNVRMRNYIYAMHNAAAEFIRAENLQGESVESEVFPIFVLKVPVNAFKFQELRQKAALFGVKLKTFDRPPFFREIFFSLLNGDEHSFSPLSPDPAPISLTAAAKEIFPYLIPDPLNPKKSVSSRSSRKRKF